VRAQFEALKNEREGVLEAEVQSAFELPTRSSPTWCRRLEKKTGRKVRAKLEVNKDLIAGCASRSRPGDRRLRARAAWRARDGAQGLEAKTLRSFMQLNPSEISETHQEPHPDISMPARACAPEQRGSVTDGICRIHGLSDVMQGEMLEFPEKHLRPRAQP
jgi:hypothetical protein